MTAMSKEISYGAEMLAPTLTMCPVVSTPMNTFQEAGESFLSPGQMFSAFSHKYGQNKYTIHSCDCCFLKLIIEISIFREITLSDFSNQTLFGRIVMSYPSKGQYPLVMCAQYHPPVRYVPVSFDYQV